MKTRTLILIVILFTSVVFGIGSCVSDKMAYISKEYEIYGTWVNPDYNKETLLGKVVFHPNGIMEGYGAATGPAASDEAEFVITNKWTDSKGNIWYTIIYKFFVQWEYGLLKISNSGKTLEFAYGNEYPKEIDSSDIHSVYLILYRQ